MTQAASAWPFVLSVTRASRRSMTYYMSPLAAIAFLVGVNKGGTSGCAIPAILLNSPGTPEAAAAAFDGYPMTKKGEADRAMKFALYSSVSGDAISDMLLIVPVVPFAAIAIRFGPLEYTSVVLFAFALLAGISGDPPIKGLIAIFLGVFLSTIGLDPVESSPGMTFDRVNLYDGLPLTAVAVGALALASVLEQLFDLSRHGDCQNVTLDPRARRAKSKLPFAEFFSHWKTIGRSALIGSGVGMLPSLGVTLAAFLSYGAARRASKEPSSFGKGNPRGIIATEAANSAVVGANLVPTIALGIPGNIAAALLIGGFHHPRHRARSVYDGHSWGVDLRTLCLNAHRQRHSLDHWPARNHNLVLYCQGSETGRPAAGHRFVHCRSVLTRPVLVRCERHAGFYGGWIGYAAHWLFARVSCDWISARESV